MRGGLRFHRMASKSYWGVNIGMFQEREGMTLRKHRDHPEPPPKDLTQNQKPGAIAQQTM